MYMQNGANQPFVLLSRSRCTQFRIFQFRISKVDQTKLSLCFHWSKGACEKFTITGLQSHFMNEECDIIIDESCSRFGVREP